MLDPGDGALVQVRELTGGNHFLGQSEAVAHFGLGPDPEQIARLTVRWPGGRIEEFTDVAPNQTLTLLGGGPPPIAGTVEDRGCAFPPLPPPARL